MKQGVIIRIGSAELVGLLRAVAGADVPADAEVVDILFDPDARTLAVKLHGWGLPPTKEGDPYEQWVAGPTANRGRLRSGRAEVAPVGG